MATPQGVFQNGDQRSSMGDRRTNTIQRMAEQLKTYAIVGTAAGALFAGGYNWRGVRDVEVKMSALDQSTVKKDVLASELKVLATAMDALRRELELMRQDHQRERSQR